MRMRRLFVCLFSASVLGLALAAQVTADDKKDEKKSEEGRKGTVTGVVTGKGENWIEVKADGEEKARKYVPHWRGGAPNQGGGPDKKMMAQIKEVPLKSRVRVEWVFEERPRVEKLEILKKAEESKEKPKGDKPKEEGSRGGEEGRKGTVTGILTAKGDLWIEIKADGEEKARRYYRGGQNPAIMSQVKDVSLNSRVRLEWSFAERLRADKLEVLKKGEEKREERK